MLEGRVPGTGIRLDRLRDGAYEHRPGFDITFSAPKSVSLAALLPTKERPRGDRAVIRAHDEAVTEQTAQVDEVFLGSRALLQLGRPPFGNERARRHRAAREDLDGRGQLRQAARSDDAVSFIDASLPVPFPSRSRCSRPERAASPAPGNGTKAVGFGTRPGYRVHPVMRDRLPWTR